MTLVQLYSDEYCGSAVQKFELAWCACHLLSKDMHFHPFYSTTLRSSTSVQSVTLPPGVSIFDYRTIGVSANRPPKCG
jgi:hypothetical protein